MDHIIIRNYLTMLTEMSASSKELITFKQEIAARIKSLPADDDTLAALREIEDLLKHVNAGGRMGIINGELTAINDATVDAARKELARFILSLPQTPEQRDELFALWKADKLVNCKKLLTAGKQSFDTLVKSYNSNPLITAFVNEVMHVSALGQGKGEFGLSVLSKSIHKQEGKGDLSISGRPIEVKTTDGGAGRFTDQEVRPSSGFEAAANELNKFVTTNPESKLSIPKSGVSLSSLPDYYQTLNAKDKKKLLTLVEKVITLIMGGRTDHISDIMSAIKSGNVGEAMQYYSQASFDYYMSKKKDEGVLYINVSNDPITTVFFKNADDLKLSSLRLHAGTAYITSVSDHRLPYPQIEIINTTFGANAYAKQQAHTAKQEKLAQKKDAIAAKANKIIKDISTGTSTAKLTPTRTKAKPALHVGATNVPDRSRRK